MTTTGRAAWWSQSFVAPVLLAAWATGAAYRALRLCLGVAGVARWRRRSLPVGAPWLDAVKLARRMDAENLPGVRFRPAWFRPTFQKFAGQDCGGVQMHVTDREAFQPVRSSLALLAAMREMSGDKFAWRTEVYEFVSDPIAIDLLFGSARERKHLEAGKPPADLHSAWQQEETAFRHRRHTALLYD